MQVLVNKSLNETGTSSLDALRPVVAPEILLQNLLAHSSEGILCFDLQFRCTVWNPRMERISGQKAESILGCCLFDACPFLGEPEEREQLHATLDGRRGVDQERVFTLVEAGRKRHFTASYCPLLDAEGSLMGGMAFIHDVTERQERETAERRLEALQQSESRFRELAEAIPHIVWTAQANGTSLEYCNQRWCEYTGGAVQGHRQDSWALSIHPEFLVEVQERWNRAIHKGELYELEYPLRGQDGNYRWHLDRAVPLRDGEGRIVKWFGTCTDIHEKKEAEEMVLKLNVELERRVHERTSALSEINEQMESFCYSVSHDLRAPVRAMRAFTQILMDDYTASLDLAARDYLQRIGAAADRMDRLIQDLLQYSRIGRMAITLEPVDLRDAVEGVLTDLRLEAKQKKATIEIVDPLPILHANSTLLDQVLLNLISNALKFVPDGTAPDLKIWTEVHDGIAKVWIRDNGIGIPPDYHKRIFEIFERLHGSELFPGTGIGLAIVQKSISRMQGRLGVVSGVDQGSCFWFELPVTVARETS